MGFGSSFRHIVFNDVKNAPLVTPRKSFLSFLLKQKDRIANKKKINKLINHNGGAALHTAAEPAIRAAVKTLVS